MEIWKPTNPVLFFFSCMSCISPQEYFLPFSTVRNSGDFLGTGDGMGDIVGPSYFEGLINREGNCEHR